MVSEAIREHLMPFVSLEYGGLGEVSLDERVLYVEHYQPYHEVGGGDGSGEVRRTVPGDLEASLFGSVCRNTREVVLLASRRRMFYVHPATNDPLCGELLRLLLSVLGRPPEDWGGLRDTADRELLFLPFMMSVC